MAAEQTKVPAPAPAAASGFECRMLRAMASVLLVAAAAAGAWGVFVALDRIEQSGQEYLRWGQILKWSTLACSIVVAAAGVFAWDIEPRALRSPFRFAAIVAAVSMLLAFGPVPAGYGAGLLLMIAAARFTVAALFPVGTLVRPRVATHRMRLHAAAAVGAFLCATAAMCAMKLNGLGWAYGID